MRKRSKACREELQRQHRQDEEARKWREAEIAKMEKRGGEITDADLEGIDLFRPRPSPDQQFIHDQIRGATLSDFEERLHRAYGDLIASDIPLSRHTRQMIASEWRLCHLPEKQRRRLIRDSKRRAEVWAADSAKQVFTDRGMTAAEADAAVVDCLGEALGVSDAESLKKKRQRAKDRGDKN
jgi:hypothetical protein